MKIEYQRDVVPSERELVELYSSVGWTSYTRDPAQHLFYRAMGFTETLDMSPAVHAFAKV